MSLMAQASHTELVPPILRSSIPIRRARCYFRCHKNAFLRKVDSEQESRANSRSTM